MWLEVIERKRQKYKEAQYLSDWQVHSAHLTSSAIKFTYDGYEEGPYFVPMPTGSGKTTGAIWGIIELLEKAPTARLCFLTPYIEAVEDIYQKVSQYLGPEVVGRYHSAGIEDKSSALQKQVVILTHQFLSYNPADLLADRDLFIVDEALYATGEATLKLSDIAKAREWAEANNVMAEEFVKLYDYANSLDRKLRKSGNKHVAGEKPESSDWVVKIATNLTLSDHSQTISDHSLLSATIRFCEALLAGMVFVSKTTTYDDTYNPTFSAAVFGIPNIEKTVVLSATGGLLYSIAGPFKQDSGSRDYWSPPKYTNLTLKQLFGPELPSTYSHWNNETTKQKVVEYLDWLLQQIPETNLYLTFPKSVVDKALRTYFNQPERGELDYPYVTTKYGKQINVSHHAVSIGTNKFKDCDAVLYLWDNHIPSSVAIQRFHILSDEPVTDESLEDAIGAQRVKSTPLTEITRADANALRDHLLIRMKPSSVKRYITVVRAAVNYVITEHTLNIPNVFNGVRIKGATATAEDRLPLSDADLAAVLPNFAVDPVAYAIFVTLADTGARLAEITGLEVQDVDMQQACVHLRPNSIRRLKTKSSKRVIPLSPRALELLQQHRQGKEDSDPIFADFAKTRGNDAASSTLMKLFRKTITDTRLSTHSLRHRMKDKLRNTGCPEAVSMAILGHGTNTVAANYGSGYAINVMREHLERAWSQ